MKNNLIKLIKSLPKESRPDEQADGLRFVDELQEVHSLKLPKDYLSFVKTFHQGTIKGDEMVIHLESPKILIGHNMDERFIENIPDMFVIGDDAGGSIYFYDPTNALGNGAYAVYIVQLGSLFIEDSIFAGVSLTEVVESIIKGDNFFDRPTIEESNS